MSWSTPTVKTGAWFPPAAKLIREGLVEPILIGDPEKVRTALQESGETGVSLQVVNPYNPALLQHNAAEYMAIQKAKGKDISEEEAVKAVQESPRCRCPHGPPR